MKVLVGNWRPGQGKKGISVYDYDEVTGDFSFLYRIREDAGVSFIGKLNSKDIIYATNETDACKNGSLANQIVALDIANPDSVVYEIDKTASLGPNPTWICCDESEKYLLVTHHGGFSFTTTVARAEDTLVEKIIRDESHIVLFRLCADGTFDRPVDAYLPGKLSRSHSIHKVHDKNLYLVCDKGLDCVFTLAIDYVAEKIIPGYRISVPEHTAPRYGVFHPRLPIFYADMEGSTDIYAFVYGQDGALQIRQTLTLGENLAEEKVLPSDIVISKDGKHLYTGIRGNNVIAVIDLDNKGKMVSHTMINNPDGAPNILRFSPDNRFLFVTNIFEQKISQFLLKENGSIEYIRTVAEDECPATLIFV